MSKWPSAVYMSLVCLIECSKMAFAHVPCVKFINGLLCLALKWLFQMCDSKFKELHTIFNLFWLFCAFHTCCLLFYPAVTRLSVCVGLAAGFSSPLRFWPLEGAVSNGKKPTLEWMLARRRWTFHYQRFTQCCRTHLTLRSQRDRHQPSRMYLLFWYMKFKGPVASVCMFSKTLLLNICICQPDLSDWCHLCTNSSTAPVFLELVSRKFAKMFYCSLNYACFHICCWISSCVIYDLPFWTWTGTVFQSYKLSNCPSSLTAYLSQDIKQT